MNPLQGKHMPVAPDQALAMMTMLGKTVKEKHAGVPLVIGFSETATAIGAAVASEIGNQCLYMQTTREADEDVHHWIYFSEEHSHATEQKLCGDDLDERISHSDYILLVDDEISTGNTILNIASAIRRACPAAIQKEFVVASIINRVDDQYLMRFSEQKISFVFLLHLDIENYEEKVKGFTVREAEPPKKDNTPKCKYAITQLSAFLPEPRRGVRIGQYKAACQKIAKEILEKIIDVDNKRVLVLGTEEFMLPPLLLAEELAKTALTDSVKFHATTRSPIGVCSEDSYPITNGIRIHSFYSKDRVTYLYDIEAYDLVIIFTDSQEIIPEAIEDLVQGLGEKHCHRALFFYGGNYV